MKKYCYLLIFMLPWYAGFSQTCRYLEEVFPAVKVTPDIVYGYNASILEFPVTGEAIRKPLLLDLYEPADDSVPVRALIIYFHSGNFLPYPDNGSVVGTRTDSSSVEICKKLARCGYVVASADYRLGWNPIAPEQYIRTTGIINAAYRGLQDANTCIRFFRKSVLTHGNPYQIDDERITLFGDDTGGYLAVQASALDTFSKILAEPQLHLPNGIPMISEYLNGDIEGKQFGVNTPQHPVFPFPAGDTLCYANYPEYSSHFRASVNLAGAVVDTTWIDSGQPPIISMHVPWDFTTPYMCDGLSIPQIGHVINVCGSYAISATCTENGNNGWFKISPDGYENEFQANVDAVAKSRNDGLLGLLPLYGDTITDINPWEFWGPENVNKARGLALNPHMSKAKAVMYMDSILAYTLPRLFEIMDLEPLVPQCSISKTPEVLKDNIDIVISPNPSSSEINIKTPEEYVIRKIFLSDMSGRLLKSFNAIDQHEFDFSINTFSPGMYILELQFDQGISTRQIIIQ